METKQKFDALANGLSLAATAINTLLGSQIVIVTKLLDQIPGEQFLEDKEELVRELRQSVDKCKDLAIAVDELADRFREEENGSN